MKGLGYGEHRSTGLPVGFGVRAACTFSGPVTDCASAHFVGNARLVRTSDDTRVASRFSQVDPSGFELLDSAGIPCLVPGQRIVTRSRTLVQV